MLNEILPLPVPTIFVGDLLNFKFYRNSNLSNNISLALSNTLYVDLPISVVPYSSTDTSVYIVSLKNNIITYSNNITHLFKLGEAGLYKYDIELECFSNFSGVISVVLTNSADVVYKNDVILIKDITSASSSIKFSAILNHAANDSVKLKFNCVKNGGGPINLNISYINLYIEKK